MRDDKKKREEAAKRRKRGPRFTDIATAAGVSEATVDRVLNERDSVSEATRRRVLAAAARLGVRRILPQSDHALVHLDILLPKNDTPFFRRLTAALRDSTAMLDRRVVVHRTTLPEGDTFAMAEAIRHPPHLRAGFILAAPDLPLIRGAVSDALARGEMGVAVVADLPDLPGLAYVGIDNRQAGVAAGNLMGRMTHRLGRVIVLGCTPAFRAHGDRQDGFRDALAEFPHLTFDLVDADTRDDPERCFYGVRRALSAPGTPVVGIYNSGAGSEGIARALASHAGSRPNWIGHEITDDHIGLLRQGVMDVAIDQDPQGQAFAALQRILHMTGITDRPPSTPRGELRVYTRFVLP